MRFHLCLFAILVLSFIFAVTVRGAADAADRNSKRQVEGEMLFASKVSPMLKSKCLACHGNDEKKIKGGLDLRSRQATLKGGESGMPAIVPGQPEKSPLFVAVTWRDPELEMPPKKNDRLTESQIADLRRWIELGAPWPDADRLKELVKREWSETPNDDGVQVKTSGGLSDSWTYRRYAPADLWAYQLIKLPAVPPSKSDNPIDAFVEAARSVRKLTASPSAGREALIRRATFGLTGLPPTEKDIKAFVQSKAPNAFAELIDRLLASDHYGERMAQHWLDVTRFADTNGFSRDEHRPDAWKYRDYVIRAFNEDKLFNRFILEQLAADELEDFKGDAQAPLGFLWTGPWEHTAMSVAAVTRQLWLDDVTNNVGVTFLGHELRCAKCHDHKFDPIPIRDYYSFQAVFASTAHSKGGGRYEIKSKRGESSYILLTGSLENPGDRVEPAVLSAVARGHGVPETDSGRRLALANWIASPKNPLTARVIVNRVWQWHFGKGLVATPNNFGKTGGKPSHPGLLDWLAAWFIDEQRGNWSVKKLHRLILSSDTYQQNTQHPNASQFKEIDPENKLLWRFEPRRLTAEEIRDSMLAVTGELNRKVGGQSVYPEINWEVAFQPRLLMGKLAPPYQPSPKRAERNRRTLYAVRIRGLRDPMLDVFNQPSSELSCERRDETTITPQVFTLLHGEFAHERAVALASRAGKTSKSLERRIEHIFVATYGRKPSNKELALAQAHVQALTKLHEKHKVEPKRLPTQVTLETVRERDGSPTRQKFTLKNLQNYEEDLKPWDVDADVRALADLCLVLLNSSAFLYVY